MELFGSSGIRKTWSYDLFEIAGKIGCALGSLYDEIVVGYDSRTTSHALLSRLVGGICAAGGNAYVAGLVPTPVISYAARNFDCGVMITASHNPPQYNGIKIWKPDGSPPSEEECEELENLMKSAKIVEWESTGKTSTEDITQDYIEDVVKRIEHAEINVIVDGGNGAASYFTPTILSEIGCRTSSLNCNPNGKFPGRDPEPSETSLEILKKLVLRCRCDLGVANDGDGDRFIAVTRKGRVLSGDEILSIIINYIGIKEVVVPVDSSMLIENFAKVHRCKVGDAFVSNIMKNKGVRFGGENSGTQIFADRMYSPDGIFSAALFAKIAGEIDIDDELEHYPKYFTLRRSFYYRDKESLSRKIEELCGDKEVLKLDGWRVNFEDGWLLIRFSGTEPKLRITVEAQTEDKAKEILQYTLEKLRGEIE